MKKHLLVVFVLLISKLALGQTPCLSGTDYTFTASPPPTNGSYAPGTTVTFCLDITNFDDNVNSNWLHGITPTLGPGWNVSTVTATTTPPSSSGSGTWSWYPGGETGTNSGTHYGAGFYYETSSGASCGCTNNNPGDNYGDYATCCWTFCFSATTNNNCTTGTSLDVTVTVTGDYLSGSWTSTGCQNDAVPTLNATCAGGCSAPTMSSSPASCANPNGGSATATPSGTNSPWTYNWSNGTNQTLSTASTISGLAAGPYTVTVTDNSSCSTTASVTVGSTNNVSAGPAQTVSCVAALPGGTATMAATGGPGTWTAQGGNPGTATITTPSSATTTITGFTAAGTYTFVWTVGACVTTTTVTVTANPSAGPNQTVSCAVLPGGTATMAAGGAGTWTPQVGNPGSATITTPTSPTTTITTFSAPGVYTFIWTNGSSCTATATVTVTAKPDAGLDQIVSCAVIPGGSATMAATGAGTWTAWSGNPGTATITAPGSPTTTITAFSVPGIYDFIWTNGSNCADTAAVTVTAKPDAGPDQNVNCLVTFPGGTATMAATGAGTWTAWTGNPGTATITAPTSPTTTITTFSAAGTYDFIWTNSSNCTDTAAVIVSAKPDAGPDDTVCPNRIPILDATGTGMWTQLPNNPIVTVITAPSNANTSVAGFALPGSYGYVWTAPSGCTDTAYILIYTPPVLVTSVANISCTNPVGVIYAGNSSSPFTYQWSNGSTADSITTTTSGVNYTVTVTDINNCTSTATDSVKNFIIIVGLTDSILPVTCFGYNDGQIMVNATPPATYTYVWSNGESGASISGLPPANNYTVTATDSLGCSATGGPYTVTSPTADSLSVTPPDTIMALGDTIQLGFTLTGAYPATSYLWTPAYGLSCDTCPNPLFIPVDLDTIQTTYTLVVTYFNGCKVSASDTLLARTNDLVAIPDAFTPNGDGINDIFFIPAWSVKEFHMAIYNRWGTQVFEGNDINVGWDGTYKGVPQPEEVYTFYFTILHFDGKTESHEGSLTLFR